MAFVIPTKESFREMYHQCAPWDIGRPQKDFVEAGPQIKGSILDVGCGTGENALYFAKSGQAVTGVDFLEEPIARAKQKAAERKIKATFQVQDALALADLRQQFDSAIDSGLFHTFSDEQRPKYVAGLVQVLKPGGKLFLMCFSDKEPGDIGPRRVSQAELRSEFSKGWKIESIKETHFEITKELPPNMKFSPGGPFAWFAVITRQP
jgi:cyclopropane fatty-acyl-phospholipid synthase-like methyltransferase